jgi:hypothetical protein
LLFIRNFDKKFLYLQSEKQCVFLIQKIYFRETLSKDL